MLGDYSIAKSRKKLHHENIVNPERCVVRSYMRYITKCPDDVIDHFTVMCLVAWSLNES